MVENLRETKLMAGAATTVVCFQGPYYLHSHAGGGEAERGATDLPNPVLVDISEIDIGFCA